MASYYGGQIKDYLGEAPKAPLCLHLGKSDELIPPGDVDAIRTRTLLRQAVERRLVADALGMTRVRGSTAEVAAKLNAARDR